MANFVACYLLCFIRYVEFVGAAVQKVKDREELLRQVLPHQVRCAEVGVFCGNYSASILKHTNPEKLFLIDPWRPGIAKNGVDHEQNYQSVCARFKAEIDRGQVELVRKTSVEAASCIPDSSLSWVYIDANHRFTYVWADILTWLPKVPVGTGIIAGHDFIDQPEFGVIEAVLRAEELGLMRRFVMSGEQWASFAAYRLK